MHVYSTDWNMPSLVFADQTLSTDIAAGVAGKTPLYYVAASGWYYRPVGSAPIQIAPSTGSAAFPLLVPTVAGRNLIDATGQAGVIPLQLRHTTEQVRLEYDATKYASFTVDSSGDLTIAPFGGDTNITGDVTVAGRLATGGSAFSDANSYLQSTPTLSIAGGASTVQINRLSPVITLITANQTGTIIGNNLGMSLDTNGFNASSSLSARGASSSVIITGATGTTTFAAGFVGLITKPGAAPLTRGASFYGAAHTNAGGGAYTTAIGLALEAQTVGTANVNFYTGAIASVPSAAGSWNWYSPLTTNNVLAGSLSLRNGVTAPTAYLHLGAGTTAASTAPLKFTAGSNNTTAEVGALEYDGSRLLMTNISARESINMARDVIIASTTVANTTTPTTVWTTPHAANTLKTSKVYRLPVQGRYSTANGTDTFTLVIKIGSTTLHTFTSAAAGVTNVALWVEHTFTVRSTGAGGTIWSSARVWANGVLTEFAGTATTTVDTTAAEDVTVVITWSNALAGNTLSVDQGYSTIIN